MTAPTILIALAGFALAWTVLSLLAPRDLRLMSVLLLFLLPPAIKVALAEAATKEIVAVACAAPLPGLVVGALRARQREAFDRHPLFPFALLYAAAAVYGLVWALLRGNDPVLAIGQSFTGALLVCGFFLAGPVLWEQATPRFWLLFLAGIGALIVPGLLPFASWLTSDEPGMIRFVDATALYAPLAVLISIGVVAPRYRSLGVLAAAVFLAVTLVTFTRSYWMGLTAGALVLAGLWIATAARRPLRPPRPSLRGGLLAVVVASGLVAFLVATPVAGLAVERIALAHRGSVDLAIDMRALEMAAALEQLRSTPLLGIGSGGEYLSIYHSHGTEVAYGLTNFTHNGYLYFPLKFGVLGLAAVLALAVGFVAALVGAARRTATAGTRAGAFVAPFTVILAASVTAPNLVDPVYSGFAGALAFLAGVPARASAPSATSVPADSGGVSSMPATVARRDPTPRTEERGLECASA